MGASAGYASHASGLLVPEAVARRRVVLPRSEWKQIDRAARVLNQHEIATIMRCGREGCPQPILSPVRRHDGSVVLRCGCTDRVLSRAL